MADDVPPSKPIKIGGLTLSRRAALGTLVVLLYVVGAAFVVGYSNHSSRTGAATPTNTQTAVIKRCWDGKKVENGSLCSTDYDGKSLFWAFGVDPTTTSCERSKDYDWSGVGFSCKVKGGELRMAIWRTADWRDQRLTEYGKPESVGRGLLLHGARTAGTSGRQLLRYDSDVILLYASVKADDSEVLDHVIPHAKSRTELLHGARAAASGTPSTPAK